MLFNLLSYKINKFKIIRRKDPLSKDISKENQLTWLMYIKCTLTFSILNRFLTTVHGLKWGLTWQITQQSPSSPLLYLLPQPYFWYSLIIFILRFNFIEIAQWKTKTFYLKNKWVTWKKTKRKSVNICFWKKCILNYCFQKRLSSFVSKRFLFFISIPAMHQQIWSIESALLV